MLKFAVLSILVAVAAADGSSSEEGGHHQGPSTLYRAPPPPAYPKPHPTYPKPNPVYHAPAPAYPKPTPVYHAAAPTYHAPAPKYGGGSGEYSEPARYDFTWTAKAGGDVSGEYGRSHTESAEFGHTETRDGDKTNGKYWVTLPDGRLQTVEYIVDGDSGYLAKVSHSGDEHRPAYQ